MTVKPNTTWDVGLRVSAGLDELLSTHGKLAFAEYFVKARDIVEAAFYADLDQGVTPGQRARRFLGLLIGHLVGRKIEDLGQFYDLFGRLWRWAWLSVSLGTYNDDIRAIPDPARRLLVAQVNTVDLVWEATIRRLFNTQEESLLVEVGTGRGNSVIRLASLLPYAKIVSITLSAEQAEIASRIAKEVGADNVEVRLGNIFDRNISQDLVGKAAAVAALEVVSHFPVERKAEGIGIMAGILKPGGLLSLMDFSKAEPATGFLKRLTEGLSWTTSTDTEYLSALTDANIALIKYANYTRFMYQTFTDSAEILRANRDRLREEFGWFLAATWPAYSTVVYLPTVKRGKMEYIHLLGTKQ